MSPTFAPDDVLLVECSICHHVFPETEIIDRDEGPACEDCNAELEAQDDEPEESDFMRQEFERDAWCRRFGIPNGDPSLRPDGTGRDGD